MWLGAMDDRIAVTVSAGFLTYMDQLERNHCMCWKFEGLRDLVDFPDVYALVAPRALLCQNGKREPADQFPPAVALRAIEEIRPAFADQGAEGALVFVAHDGGHEIDMPSMWAFLAERLGVSPE